MALAMIYPEGQKGKRVVQKNDNFSRQRLSQARSVLRHSQELAESVLRGSDCRTWQPRFASEPSGEVASY